MISPDEMKKKTFNLALRGYTKSEVDAYIALIADQYAEQMAKLSKQCEELTRQNAILEEELAEMRANEDAIRKALVNSQHAATRVVENARQKGEEIEKLTREKCGEVIAEFREQIRAERERLNLLRTQVANFKARLFEQYQTHIEAIEGITSLLGEEDWDMTPSDATRKVLTLLRGDFERRTRNDEIEEMKIDRDIDIVIDKLTKNQNATDSTVTD